MNKTIWILLFLVALAGTWNLYSRADADSVFKKQIWHYRLTVEVETPEGVKSGFVVREVTYQRGIHITPEMLPEMHHYGEAVVVDLGKGGVLFGTMDQASMDTFFKIFIRDKATGKVTLNIDQYPVFVHFKDMSDPKSIEPVFDFERRYNNVGPRFTIKANRFEEIYGSGVVIKAVTMEMTDEPITVNVRKLIPWVLEYKNKMLDGERHQALSSKNPFANKFSGGSFCAGVDHGR